LAKLKSKPFLFLPFSFFSFSSFPFRKRKKQDLSSSSSSRFFPLLLSPVCRSLLGLSRIATRQRREGEEYKS
jgi:hypothetical protein